MAESLFYFLVFVFIVAIKFFLGKPPKDILQKHPRKRIADVHKKVRSGQKYYRKSNREYPAASLPPLVPKIVRENPKSSDVQTKKTDKNFTENRKSISLNKRTLKSAVVLKEILDSPIALR